MSLIEVLRDHHQKRRYDKPMKRREHAPVANNLLDEIDRYIDVTPEFTRAAAARRIENRATQKINGKAIEYDTPLGHFSILKGKHTMESGEESRGAVIHFTPIVNGERDGTKSLTIKANFQPTSSTAVNSYSNKPFVPMLRDFGSFSIKGSFPGSEDKKLEPNSHETLDEINSLLPILFPTLPQRERMMSGVSER